MPSQDFSEVWAYECPCCYETYKPGERPEDGRCNRCKDEPNLREKQSEFGAGLVVCLAKFSEHLGQDNQAWELVWYARGKRKLEQLSRSAQITLELAEGSRVRMGTCLTVEDYAVDEAISHWANAASDHLAEICEDQAPQPLRELTELMFWLRNNHFRKPFKAATGEDLERVRELWKQSCLALDRKLGIKPNWGEY